ncbi:DUF5704 domain-containing protein [Paenibacillus sp. PDC88]|uniref:DUF5704 domain-containing protein n=1 Tax=Paenibacillus provencensis TaxID=441151 RepID=A0ABW3PTQ7_9BACL|nr:DUF5704 domain-containing protein [Paenibacillus sp. PDC88]SDX62200.1 hypothetical protein SAMN05518848_11048 [Paenibacillus sp. PDC88]
MKKMMSSLLSAVLILSSILVVFTLHPGKAEAAVFPISSNRLLQDEDNPNLYYFVGMVYYEVWKNNSGQWTGGGHKPGDTVAVVDGGTYEFTFGSSRKIKDIRIKPFDFNWELADETFETSRTGELAVNRKQYYQDATSTRSYNNYRNTPVVGKGTNVGQKEVFVLNGTLEAVKQVDRRLEEETENGQIFGENVEGWRYFFPTLFTIELEPEEGKAIVQHWTTTGQRLNNVDGFQDREEKLEKNVDYRFTHTPGTEEYTYVGHKKSTVEPPSGGEITPGDPSGFKYDATFPIYYVNFYYKKEGNPPPPDPEIPEASCTAPTPGTTIDGRYMDPVVTAKISADRRGSEQFDVLQGIPTSESLYGNILARNYLAQHSFVQMSGVCTFTVNVEKTWTLHWDPGQPGPPGPNGEPTTIPDPQQMPETVVQQYTVERPYSYWVIDNLEVYKIDEGQLKNYALPGDQISITPQGYEPPEFTVDQTGAFYPPSPPNPIVAPPGSFGGSSYSSPPSPPSENLQSVAEEGVKKVEVTNDSLVFNGATIMSGCRVDESGPTPRTIPEPPQINENVLYKPGNIISSSKTNRENTTSSGTIYYGLMEGNINGGSNKNFPIYGINTVTVHTPVVNYSSVTDDREHNQKTNPNYNRAAFILDRPFTVRIPTNGQHRNYPGYGNRDYAKYFRTKQVQFPFDVYNSSRTQFYPKNTWIDIPVNQLDTEFFLPVWVDEGDYQVYFRNIAENAPPELPYQYDANLDLVNHVAVDEVSVEVIGRLYDFQVTDIADYNWESVFRTQIGSTLPTGLSYWVGMNGIDGAPRGNSEQYTLPILPGSHPAEGYKNVAVKTGYHFKFDFKTKGNMFGKEDGIRITPTFHFVSKDGQYRFPVDLYYKTNESNFVKIGSEEDKVQRYVIMNDRLRNVPAEEMIDTASFKFDNYFTTGQLGSMTKQEYTEQFISKDAKQKTPVGGYNLLLLPEQLRTFIGPKTNLPASVNVQRANAAVQNWYGEYSLPAEPYVVEAGTDIAEYGRTHGGLDDNSPIFFKNGYIIVNFDIETIRNGDLNNPHLQYINAPLMNQWQLEGYQRIKFDSFGNRFTLQDGDVVFYHADLSSRDDFSPQVPF